MNIRFRVANEEAVAAGYFVYNIFHALKLDSKLIDAVVFGWQGGRRESDIKRVIEILEL